MATQTTILNERAKLLKLRVCQLLGWTEMEYAEFQFACGKQYLQHYIPRDPEGIDELVTSKLYWNWWKLMWTNRDWAYLDENENDLQALHQSNREKLYKHLHDPHALSLATTPPGVVLEESYSKLIGEIIKKEVA